MWPCSPIQNTKGLQSSVFHSVIMSIQIYTFLKSTLRKEQWTQSHSLGLPSNSISSMNLGHERNPSGLRLRLPKHVLKSLQHQQWNLLKVVAHPALVCMCSAQTILNFLLCVFSTLLLSSVKHLVIFSILKEIIDPILINYWILIHLFHMGGLTPEI